MTFTKFFGFGFLLWLVTAALKWAFLGTSVPLQIVFLILLCLVTLACCRRLGVINFLEGAMVAVVWTLGCLLADWLFLYHGFNMHVFNQGVFWIGYIVVLVVVFFGHKKRHIQIRKEMEAHHKHGHH